MTTEMDLLDQKLAEKEALEKEIAQLMAKERKDAIARMRHDIKRFKLEPDDVFPGIKLAADTSNRGAPARGKGKGRGKAASTAGKKPRGKVAAKYQDRATGATWTGRGREPEWIKGKDRAAFLVQAG